jgi:hypothetical protein
MNSRELNRAVAKATGESLREIRHRGFSFVNPAEVDFDAEPNWLPPSTINWDQLERSRSAAYSAQNRRERFDPVGV